MIGRDAIAVILLAAGRSTRFGRPKLSAMLGGIPLAHHAAALATGRGFGWQFAVCSADTPPLSSFGYEELRLNAPAAPLSRSLATGIAAVAETPAQAALVLLADMPLIPHHHLDAMIAAFDGHCLASEAHGIPMPPAMFGRALFADLQHVTGDKGGADILLSAPRIMLAKGFELDIDTEDDLARAAAALGDYSG